MDCQTGVTKAAVVPTKNVKISNTFVSTWFVSTNQANTIARRPEIEFVMIRTFLLENRSAKVPAINAKKNTGDAVAV